MEPHRTFRSPQGLATFLTMLIVAGIVLSVVSIGSNMMELRLLEELRDGRDFTAEEIEANDARQELIGFGELALFAITAVVFLRWVYVSASNAQFFSNRLMTHSPGWCVGWYFVPIMNLFRPYQAMKEIWQVSESRPGEDWLDRPTPGILNAWWGLWILGGVLGQASFRLALRAESIEDFIVTDWVSIAALSAGIVADLVAISMIRRLVGLQEKRRLKDGEWNQETPRCPACGEEIDYGSSVCPMCGKEIPRLQTEQPLSDD